ncbi:6-phospho-3-hexuloisomerase [Priestia endophytica]|jgi:6-phospho-3-hexuloisomerase|uniref:6-phospho-3-hexuloisomerase n=1 Tax=Priestia endophytica TaxID=135735 RepID=UPI002041A89D|nr:6-phospho-3-hexuloisomerase [Priestia endophytica]MCM3538187.1 6-phospho-3-hexuloisomerase [Priestia endophytica]
MRKLNNVLKEIEEVINKIDQQHLDDVAFSLHRAKRIFVIGEGRSGLMAKSFAMRLMHLGATVFVVGETITPSITKNDLLVAVSGSGKTQQVVTVTQKSKQLGCSVIAVTTNPASPLSEHATEVIHIPAATKYRNENEAPSIQPLGSLFDQCAHVVFDTICLEYGQLNQVNHSDAFQQHSNLE